MYWAVTVAQQLFYTLFGVQALSDTKFPAFHGKGEKRYKTRYGAERRRLPAGLPAEDRVGAGEGGGLETVSLRSFPECHTLTFC